MSVKHENTVIGIVAFASVAVGFIFLFSNLSSIPLFSLLILMVVALVSMGKGPFAFILGILLTILAVYSRDRFPHSASDLFVMPVMVANLWLAFILMHIYRRHLEKQQWASLVSRDEEQKEVKELKREIALYEQRHSELQRRTTQRRLLSNAARELGALLDPQLIQNKLMEISGLIFPGQHVEMSFGQHRDGFDSYIFQKRQPLLVPSEGFQGPPMIAVPISSQRSVVGVLRIGGDSLRESQRAFQREDLRLLDVLASLASLAMDNCRLFQQVQQSALRDNLTGLFTQRAFQENLDAAILEASRYAQPLSLILADIDHFKSVNDNYGHQAGDQVLQGFAHILDRNARDIDTICRHGGEEFALLLLQSSHQQACAIAERIRMDLSEQAFETEKGLISVNASFGVATFPEDATSAQQLFRQADQRLYKAKNNGRNRTQGREC